MKNKYLFQLALGIIFLTTDLFMLFSDSVRHSKYHNIKFGFLAIIASIFIFTSTVMLLRSMKKQE